MRRFLTLWLTLLAAFWLARSALSAALFGQAETDREAVWLLLVVPAVQALLLSWLTRSPDSRPVSTAGRELLALPFAVVLLVADAVLIAAGLTWPGSPWLGLAAGRVVDFYTGAKLASAGLAFGLLAIRGRGLGDAWIWLPLSGRSRVALLSAGLLLYALSQLGAGLEIVLEPLLLFELYEEYPWVVSSVLLAAGLLLLASLEPTFARHSRPAATALTAAAATSLAAGLVTLLAALPEPGPEEPWGTLIGALGLLAATFLLLAPTAALFPGKPGSSRIPQPALVLMLLLPAAGAVGARPLAAQVAATPANLGFEAGATDGSLPAWIPSKPGEGFTFRAERTAESPFEGAHAALLTRTGRGRGVSGLLQVIDARPLRGRRVVLRGALRARAEPGRGSAFLFLQANTGSGEGPPVPGPRAAEEWRLQEVVAEVARDAETLQFGVLLSGEAQVAADAFSLALAGGPAAGAGTPRPLSDGGRENLAAFTRLVGLVRYFHPADGAALLDWDRFTVAAVGPVEAAAGPDALVGVLSRLFAPVAPSVAVFRQGQDPGPVQVATTPPGSRIVGWRHYGLGTGTAESQASYRSERLAGKEPPATPGRLIRPLAAAALAGRRVRLEADARLLVPGTRAALFLEAAGADGLPLARERRPVEASPGWRRLALELALPPQVSQLTLGLELAGAGRAALDDVRLATSPLESEDGPLLSRLFQDGFETALPDPVPHGWILDFASEAAGFKAGTSTLGPAGGRRHAELSWEPDVTFPEAGTAVTVDLGAGVEARVPLAVPAGERGSPSPAPTSPVPPLEPGFFSGDDRATRLAAVVLAGAALEHFYPYFDAVPVDWPASVRRALSAAATDSDGRAFHRTLSRLTGDLHDGHAYASWAGGDEDHRLPLLWRVIGDELVVTAVDPAEPAAGSIRPGDAVLAIDGRPVAEALAEAAERASASTSGFRQLKAANLLTLGRRGAPRRLTLRRGSGDPFAVTLSCALSPAERERLRPPRPAPIAEVRPGIWYVDLDRTADPEIERALPRLAKARGIVFDLRGYPTDVTPDLLFGHLIEKPVPFGGDRVPVRTRPDRVERYDLRRRWLLPVKPRLAARAVFLTGERAISRAEIYLSLATEERLGTIVGARTAGTRGEVDELPLPGGYRVYWTAARTLTTEGKPFQGRGVIPDVAVQPTKEGIAAGRDEALEKAIEIAATGGARR